MSYIYAEKANCAPDSPYPLGNDDCPWCDREILIREQMEDGPLDCVEKCECPWCGCEFDVNVEYLPHFYAHKPYEWD